MKVKVEGNIILTVVTCGCESRSLTLRKKDKLWVLENRALRQTFKLKGVEIRRWRRLYNKEIYDIFSSPNDFRPIKSKMMGWDRSVVCMEENKNI